MPFSQESVLELTVFGRSASGQQVLNVFHYRQANAVVTAYGQDQLVDMVGDFRGLWNGNILPVLSTDYSVEKYRGRAFESVQTNPTPPPPTFLFVGEQYEEVPTVPEAGLRAGDPLPSFAAVGVQKLSSRAGRNFRGSARFGTAQEGDTVANSWTSAYLTLLNVNIEAFFAGILEAELTGQPWEMAIFSRTLALAAPPTTTNLFDFTAKVVGRRVNTFVSSQVSRKQSLTQPT